MDRPDNAKANPLLAKEVGRRLAAACRDSGVSLERFAAAWRRAFSPTQRDRRDHGQ